MLKRGVDLRGIHPVWGIAYPIIQNAYSAFGCIAVITSAKDGVHGEKSLHYQGRALDLRSKSVTVMDKGKLLKKLKDDLGEQFDVILEGIGTPNEHYHAEFQPKDEHGVPYEDI